MTRTLCAAIVAASAVQLAERPITGVLGHPAILYNTQATTDPVGDLSRRVADGSAQLAFDDDAGYLRSVMAALHMSAASQMLVMSKTGVQGLHTGPENPRALYFNDAVTLGYIRGAPFLEFAVQDATQGVVFYTLDQKRDPRPVIDRRQGCLTCHQNYSTLHVPGLVARSSFVAPDGLPLGQFGSFDPDDRTPFRQRWGGWYVTGTHGSIRHMGNAIVRDREHRDAAISGETLNRTSLDGFFDARGYPSALSDIVALMVFQHQVRMTNLITRIGWEARIAAYDHRADIAAGLSADALRAKADPLRDGVVELVDYLLFVDEQPLTDRVAGTSGFAEMFARQGPVDSRGRSLRQLDLEHRLLRYPCSYMIYSPAFQALPADVREAIYARMSEILTGRDASPKYARLTESDRRAIVEILSDTLPNVWRPALDRRSRGGGGSAGPRRLQ